MISAITKEGETTVMFDGDISEVLLDLSMIVRAISGKLDKEDRHVLNRFIKELLPIMAFESEGKIVKILKALTDEDEDK